MADIGCLGPETIVYHRRFRDTLWRKRRNRFAVDMLDKAVELRGDSSDASQSRL